MPENKIKGVITDPEEARKYIAEVGKRGDVVAGEMPRPTDYVERVDDKEALEVANLLKTLKE